MRAIVSDSLALPGPASFAAPAVRVLKYPRLLSTVVRNLIDAWPEAVYREPLVEGSVLGRKTVFVCAPDLVHSLLVDQAGSLERDDFVLRALVPMLGRGVLTSDGECWRAQRRTAAPAFRHDRIVAFVPAMTAAAEATRRRWLARDATRPIDMLAEMMRTTFDIIVATMLSDEGELDVSAFDRHLGGYLAQTPWKMGLTMLGVPGWVPHPGCLKGILASRYLRRAIKNIIESRRREGGQSHDLLGLLLEARDPETGEGMPDRALIDNLLTFVAAGHETSALVMAWTFCLLAEHPSVERRIRDEIDLASRAVGVPLDLAALTYTRQVLMEVMRLYPPAPLIARRAGREINLGGTVIPAGRSIQVPVYAVHRHRALWDAPDVFDPDRFEPKASAARKRQSYLPFGAGPRVCIGAHFAMTECVALLATLLPAFTFSRVDRRRPEARFKITLRPHGGVPLFVKPRADQ